MTYTQINTKVAVKQNYETLNAEEEEGRSILIFYNLIQFKVNATHHCKLACNGNSYTIRQEKMLANLE